MDWFRKKFFKSVYYADNIDQDVRMLRLVGFYTVAAVVLAAPCFFISGYTLSAYMVCIASFVLLGMLYGIFLLNKDVTLTAVLFCYSVNIIILPLFFVYAGGIYGGMEFIFLCGIVYTVFLLKGLVRIVSLVIYTVWYTLIVLYTGVHAEIIHNIPQGMISVFSMTMCIMFSTLIFLVIMDYERYLLQSKQNNIEEAIRQSVLSAETKSRFLSNVSHELRTPMNAIIGMSGIIQNSDVDGDLTEEISIITHNARDLLSTINSILDYSRLESEKLTLSYDQFAFDTMMREIVSEASIRAEEKGIDLFIDIDPDSPNVLYGDHLQLEMILQDLLSDAIDSVSDGRVHFRIKGAFSKDKSRARFTAEISDTGEGITDEDLQSIYSSYETYDSRQDSRIKRLGLKYSVFRGILKLMNGDFDIKSLKDVGTTVIVSFEVFTVERMVLADKTFTVGKRVLLYAYGEKGTNYLEEAFAPFGMIIDTAYSPDVFTKFYSEGLYRYIFISEGGYVDVADIVKEQDKEKVFVITDRMGTPADFDNMKIIRRPLSSLNLADIFFERWEQMDYTGVSKGDRFIAPEAKVLVVDDNMVNLKVAESLLLKYKMIVRICESGFSAIEMLKNENYDIVLMDQVMPGMDGFEAIKLIRSSLVIRGARRIPIVCMSADTASDIRERVLAGGFNDYLTKPMKEKELERVLLDYLPDDKIVMSTPEPDEYEA